MRAYERLRERLERGQTLLLDGGIGSELVRRGVRWRGNGLQSDAAAVQALHEEYLAAGADVIRTNTFQLNRRTFLNVFRSPAHQRHIGAPGLETRHAELTERAVAVARAARERAGRPEVAVAGVMSPLEHCFRPDRAPSYEEALPEHRELAGLLAAAGVDLLLIEAMNTLEEARAALEAARATGRPVWAGFVVGADGNLLSGDSLSHAARLLTRLGAEAVLVSGAPPDDVTLAVARLATVPELVFGASALVGRFDPPSWKFEFYPQFSQTEEWPPERYARAALGWVAQGARIVGGDHGTTPAHVAALRAALAAAR